MSDTSRRGFLAGSAAAASAGITVGHPAFAKTSRPPTCELISVGVVGPGGYSHTPSIWGPTLNPIDPEYWPVGRTSRLCITHCWDRDPEKPREFASKYDCTPVNNYYDMADKVDAMIFDDFYMVPWWPRLTKPYLEAGIPCHINRPFAYNMRDAREMVNRARRHNAPISVTDEREYIKEAIVGRAFVRELLKDGRQILGANSSNSAGYEYPAHGVHGLYFALAILGLDVEQVALQADGWWNRETPAVDTPMTWGSLMLQYRGVDIPDAPKQDRPFMCVQQQLTGQHSNSTMRLYYYDGWRDIDNHWTFGERMDRLYYLFFPTMLALQRMVETGEMQLFDYDYILKKTRIFLTGFKSHLDHGGALTAVDSLPDDWTAPTPMPGWIDEAIFGG